MASRKELMKTLLDERQRLTGLIEQQTREIEFLKRELATVDRMIAASGGAPTEPRRKRPSVKAAVLTLLAQHKEAGLTASEVVEADPGLDKASVSSLLSRLKKDGLLTLEGSKYRIANGAQVALEGRPTVGVTH
jgi:DNA-binding transcriptional ArsR family regulator